MTPSSEHRAPPPEGRSEHRAPPPEGRSEPPPHAAGAGRAGGDRRERPTPRFSRFTFGGGRRLHVRRPVEREGTFVDLYATSVLAVVLWVALMNIGDSYFTLVHLQSGGIEINPVAARLLETGRLGFVLSKSALISVALLVLTLHKNFWLARVGLWVAAGSYTVLVGYHLMLFDS